MSCSRCISESCSGARSTYGTSACARCCRRAILRRVMKEVTTYLNFDGNCRQAMTFYKECLGAELYLMPFSEVPGDFPPEAKNLIMHASLSKGKTLLMASDALPGMPFQRGNDVW